MQEAELQLIDGRLVLSRETAGLWLGLGYVRAALEKSGFKVGQPVLPGGAPQDFTDSLTEIFNNNNSGNILFIGCHSVSLPMVLEALLRTSPCRKARKVCLGGPGTLRLSRLLMERFTFLDAVVEGAGEDAAVEIGGFWKGGPFPRSRNLVIRVGEKIIGKAMPADSAAWFDLWPYCEMPLNGSHVAPVAWSRGCDCNCLHCVVSAQNGRLQRKDLDSVMGDIHRLMTDHGIRHFDMIDDYLGGTRTAVEQFCERAEKIDITWNCSLRTEVIDESLAARMFSAGCRHVYIGLESACQSIRSALGKPSPLAEALRAVEHCRKFMSVTCSFIWGFPFESLPDFVRTLALIRELRADGVDTASSPFVPFPGSPLTAEYAGKLIYDPDLAPLALGLFDKLPEIAQGLVRKHPDIFTAFGLLPDENFHRKVRLYEEFQQLN